MTNNPVLSKVSAAVSTLEELGLAKNEAILYDALLKTTDATIPYLLKNTSFSRTLLYYLLGNLEGYGLITSSNKAKGDGRKTVYNAEPPDKLADMLKERENEFKKQKDLLGGIMGDLYSTYRLAHNKPGVKFFEGKNGVKEVTIDSLNAKSTIYTIADMEMVGKYLEDVNSDYVKKRIELGIHKKMLVLDAPFTRARYKPSTLASKLLEVRFLPSTVGALKTSLQMYDNTISFSTLEEGKEISILIVDPFVAQMQRVLFDLLWETLPAPREQPREVNSDSFVG